MSFRPRGARLAAFALPLAWALLYGALSSVALDASLTECIACSLLLVVSFYPVVFMLMGRRSECCGVCADAVQDEEEAEGEAVLASAEEVRRRYFSERAGRIKAQYGLSDRESDVFIELAGGRNVEYVSAKLHISPHTVKTHMMHIYRKLGIHSQQELLDLFNGNMTEEMVNLA